MNKLLITYLLHINIYSCPTRLDGEIGDFMLFVNFVEEKFKDGANYSFGYNGISCQVNEARENDMNYYTELYYGDKYIRWGRFDGEMFSQGGRIQIQRA